MIRLYALIMLVVMGYWVVRKLLASENSLRALYNKTTFFVIAGLMLLLLGFTGHLAWLPAMAGVLMAFLVRNLPLILRFAPQWQKIWYRFKGTTQQQGSAKYSPPPSGRMTVMEAYKVLGLTPPVAKQDIVLAHKKLMQKMHPDRGGSDYLASQINLAKDLLLKN